MGAIFYRQFSTGSVPYLTLGGEEFVRPLSIGTDWTALRICMLCAATPTNPASPANLTNVDFFMGLCNYGGGSYAGSQCANAVGLSGGTGAPLGTWTYTAGPPAYWTTDALNWTRRVNGVITRRGSNNGFLYVPTIGKRWVFSVIITKNVIQPIASSTSNTTTPDWQMPNLLDLMDSPVYNSTIVINGTSVTLTGLTNDVGGPLSEASGVLNALNIYWNKAAPLEIYGIAVARIS